jgi:hypothetical protein
MWLAFTTLRSQVTIQNGLRRAWTTKPGKSTIRIFDLSQNRNSASEPANLSIGNVPHSPFFQTHVHHMAEGGKCSTHNPDLNRWIRFGQDNLR